MKSNEDHVIQLIQGTRRDIRSAIVRGPLVLLAVAASCVLLAVGVMASGIVPRIVAMLRSTPAASSLPSQTPPPTPSRALVPTPHASMRIIGEGELAAAGTEVHYNLSIQNEGVTAALYLHFNDQISHREIALYPKGSQSPIDIPPSRSVKLDPIAPGQYGEYQLVIYRRASPDGLALEPPFELSLREESGKSWDSQPIRPVQRQVTGTLEVGFPSLQPLSLTLPVTFTPNMPGQYVIVCSDVAQKPWSKPVEASSGNPAEWDCPVYEGRPGTWSVRVYPQLGPGHPDRDKLTSGWKGLIPPKEFLVDYKVAVSKSVKFDPDPKRPVVGVRYVLTNTGTVQDSVWIKYEPIRHALTATLHLIDTVGQPYSITIGAKAVPLLPPGQNLTSGQVITVEIIVEHDDQKPVQFDVSFIPGSDQGVLSKQREEFVKLPGEK